VSVGGGGETRREEEEAREGGREQGDESSQRGIHRAASPRSSILHEAAALQQQAVPSRAGRERARSVAVRRVALLRRVGALAVRAVVLVEEALLDVPRGRLGPDRELELRGGMRERVSEDGG